MNKADRLQETEIALGAESREQAEVERNIVAAERLAVAVTDFIEGRALFQAAIAEGWRHVLGYDATRDPRMEQLQAYWKQCRENWKFQPQASLPSFESWRASALEIR